MKADGKSHLSMSNYVNFFERQNFLFQKENTRKQFLQLTFLSLPSQNISFFSSQVEYSHSPTLNVFTADGFFFFPCHFMFNDFFPIHKLTLFMLIYTTWVHWVRKQSTGLGCLPNASNISTTKNKTVISAGIIFPELVT